MQALLAAAQAVDQAVIEVAAVEGAPVGAPAAGEFRCLASTIFVARSFQSFLPLSRQVLGAHLNR